MHEQEKLEIKAFQTRTGGKPNYRPVILAVLCLILLKVW